MIDYYVSIIEYVDYELEFVEKLFNLCKKIEGYVFGYLDLGCVEVMNLLLN